MKKVLCALVFIALLSGCAVAEKVKIGELTKLNITPEKLQEINNAPNSKAQSFRNYDMLKGEYKFYDSLSTMLLALNRGEVDRIILPEAVAKYVMLNSKINPVSIVKLAKPHYLAFGFKDDDNGRKLKNLFDEALKTIKESGRLAHLKEIYIDEMSDFKPVKTQKFDKAENIKIVVTGDLPPIDFIAEDGTPSGFNTAVTAECAKAAKINIKFVNVDAGARAAVLVSERVNAVFWFQSKTGDKDKWDIPNGIILSNPYYKWDELYILEKK